MAPRLMVLISRRRRRWLQMGRRLSNRLMIPSCPRSPAWSPPPDDHVPTPCREIPAFSAISPGQVLRCSRGRRTPSAGRSAQLTVEVVEHGHAVGLVLHGSRSFSVKFHSFTTWNSLQDSGGNVKGDFHKSAVDFFPPRRRSNQFCLSPIYEDRPMRQMAVPITLLNVISFVVENRSHNHQGEKSALHVEAVLTGHPAR